MLHMPRNRRCIAPGIPLHITQRGVDGRETFSTDADRATYLKLLFHLLPEAGVRLWGWCLMPNHVHLIAIPNEEDSLAVLLRRLQGRYAQYFNAAAGRMGHLWQNGYFSCMLDKAHLACALRYVDLNPVRANLVTSAETYRWSSAAAHLCGSDDSGLLDLKGWQNFAANLDWANELRTHETNLREYRDLRRCTHAGQPFGAPAFVGEMETRFDRNWQRGPRPKATAQTASLC